MRDYFNAVKWEIILDIKEYLRYRIGLLMDFIIFTGTFIAVYFMGVNQGFAAFYNTNEAGGHVLLLIGYIFWQNASAALGYCVSSISSETSRGIFEVRLQSKYAMESILFFRLVVRCLIHLVTYAGILLFSNAVIGYSMKDIGVIILAILISLLSLVGMFGMGMVFASICICEKKVGSLVLVVQTMLLLVTNTLSPSRAPIIYLIPFTSGIDIVRDIYLGNEVSSSLFLVYLVVNVVWMAVGTLCFRYALRYEKKYGAFDNY